MSSIACKRLAQHLRILSGQDALHATRLLQVEERPFQRVTRNLLGKESLLRQTPRQLPSPPPDGEDEPVHGSDEDTLKRQKFREDVLLDFAALESSITRIQLIQDSNRRERERYATEKAKILDTAQSVRDNSVELRSQLAEAQKVLELRKGYDQLVAKLIDPKKLKPRSETREDIARLEKEIEDLEQESGDYAGTWASRREAFDKVVAEGDAMVRLIKGIKSGPEADKDEEMEDELDANVSTKGERSRLGSPAHGASTPMVDGGLSARQDDSPGNDDRTSIPENEGEGVAESDVTGDSLAVAKTPQPSSRAPSPDGATPGVQTDVTMDEELESQPKTTSGMEISVVQVAESAQDETMDES